MFTEVGSETYLVLILATVAVAADEDPDLAGRSAEARDRPAGGAPDLPVVEADIADPAPRGQLGDQRDDRHAAPVRVVDRFGHMRMLRGDDPDGVDRLGEPRDALRHVVGREVVQELDATRPRIAVELSAAVVRVRASAR